MKNKITQFQTQGTAALDSVTSITLDNQKIIEFPLQENSTQRSQQRKIHSELMEDIRLGSIKGHSVKQFSKLQALVIALPLTIITFSSLLFI